MPKGVKYNISNIDNIIKEYESSDKYSQKEISEIYGITKNVFSYHYKKYKNKKNPKIRKQNRTMTISENRDNNISETTMSINNIPSNTRSTEEPKRSGSFNNLRRGGSLRKHPEHDMWKYVIPSSESTQIIEQKRGKLKGKNKKIIKLTDADVFDPITGRPKATDKI